MSRSQRLAVKGASLNIAHNTEIASLARAYVTSLTGRSTGTSMLRIAAR